MHGDGDLYGPPHTTAQANSKGVSEERRTLAETSLGNLAVDFGGRGGLEKALSRVAVMIDALP